VADAGEPEGDDVGAEREREIRLKRKKREERKKKKKKVRVVSDEISQSSIIQI